MLPFFVGVLLLQLSCDFTTGELSEDFSQCKQFFFQGTPPNGFAEEGTQPICQRYHNKYRFATLYHRQHRTPLYSAYKIRHPSQPGDKSASGKKRPEIDWMYEPQLADTKGSREMQKFDPIVPESVKNSQAVLEDYMDTIQTMGHLNPSMHQSKVEDQEATFTLTNIVPQREFSNRFTWAKFETDVLTDFKKYCKEDMYVITGVLPFIPMRWIHDRVSTTEYMWSAYCCPTYSNNFPPSLAPHFPTYAAVGRNDPNSPEDIVPIDKKAKYLGYDVKLMPLAELLEVLKKRLGRNDITLFGGQCS